MDRQAEIESYADISIHALREEGDQLRAIMVATSCIFLSTPSARRATPPPERLRSRCSDFYPRPPRGGRHPERGGCSGGCEISIHALREEGDVSDAWSGLSGTHFYPRPPRGGRPASGRKSRTRIRPISIHALREEGDNPKYAITGDQTNFYPRPPRGGRPLRLWTHGITQIFLSTPSARRATAFLQKNSAALTDFYPRPPRGGRPVSVTRFLILPSISIHALREEGDLSAGCAAFALSNFYPRPPRGGRRSGAWPAGCRSSHFYPRPPRGGRRTLAVGNLAVHIFLSTPSARRATPC